MFNVTIELNIVRLLFVAPVIFADETNPRWITATAVLDYNSAAVADKFGNIGVVSPFHLLKKVIWTTLTDYVIA